MSRLAALRAAQQERLAQLSEDNAFVDVDAALKRIGEDATLTDTPGPLLSSSSSSPLPPPTSHAKPRRGNRSASARSADAAGVSGAGGSRAGPGAAVRGSRGAEDALLSGARVPLTGSLQDQHKAYLESVRVAAEVAAEWNSDSDSDDDGGHGGGGRGAGGGRGSRSRRTGGTRGGGRGRQAKEQQQRGRPAKASVESSAAGSLTSAAEPVVAVSVLTVKTEPVGMSRSGKDEEEKCGGDGAPSPPAEARKRGRDGADESAVKQEEKQETTSGACRRDATCTQTRVVESEVDDSATREDSITDLVPQALLARLTAQLCLVEQWKRTVLEATPQLINNVLAPEPCEPWASDSIPTAAVVATADNSVTSSSSNGGGVGDPFADLAALMDVSEQPSVLPYPLLQLYSMCPSYEALTAPPVRRRGLERVAYERDRDTVETAVRAEEGSWHAKGGAQAVGAASTSTAATRRGTEETAALSGAGERAAVRGATRAVEMVGVRFAVPVGPPSRRVASAVPLPMPHRLARYLEYKPMGVARGGEGEGDGGALTSASAGVDDTEGSGVGGASHHHLCSVCLLPAAYRCVRCKVALFCSIECHVLHDATRCLKFTV